MADTFLDDTSAGKTSLGMGELWAIITTGVNVPDNAIYTNNKSVDLSFLEVQPYSVITEMKFTFDNTSEEVTVTRYNDIAIQGVLLIPPVYQQLSGKWTSITCEGQINCFGKYPIG